MRYLVALFAVACLLGAAAVPAAVAQDAAPTSAGQAEPWPSTDLWGARDITAGHGKYVIVGGTGKRGPRALVWTSQDGRTWQKVPRSPSLDGAFMSVVASFEDGFVALGTESDKGSPRSDRGTHVVAWYSPDGVKWRRGRVGRPSHKDYYVGLIDVVDGPAGLVAIGAHSIQDYGPQRLWHSDDGRTWTPVPLPESDEALLSALFAVPDGLLLTGWSFRDGERAWWSADGRSWQSVEDVIGFDDFASAPDGTVVGIGDSQIWTRSEQGSWHSLRVSPGCAEDEGLYWIAWDGSRFITTGLIDPQCPEGDEGCRAQAILVSTDGRTWATLDGPEGVPHRQHEPWVGGTASLDGSTVVLGGADGGGVVTAWLLPADRVATLALTARPAKADAPAEPFTMKPPTDRSMRGWRMDGRARGVAGLEHLAVLGERLVAVGGTCSGDDGRCREVAWHSDDASTWTPAPLEGGRPIVTDMTSTPHGLVAVGHDLGDGPDSRAAAWATQDGLDWTAIAVPPLGRIDRVAAAGDTIVVAAEEVLWVSSGASTWTPIDGPESVIGIASGRTGFMAWAGEQLDPARTTQVWSSADGFEWTEVDLPEAMRTASNAFGDVQVFALDDGWMLIPSLRSVSEAIFMSADGSEWQAVPRPQALNGKWARWAQEVDGQVWVGGTLHGDYVFGLWSWPGGAEGGKPARDANRRMNEPVPWQGGFIATGTTRGCPAPRLTTWRWGPDPASDPGEVP